MWDRLERILILLNLIQFNAISVGILDTPDLNVLRRSVEQVLASNAVTQMDTWQRTVTNQLAA